MVPDIEEDEAAIQQIVQSFFHYMSMNNLDSFISLMTEDVILLPPTMRALKGVASLKALLVPWFENLNMTHEIVETEIETDANLAYVRLEYKDTFLPKTGGKKVSMDNKALWVFKRQSDGAWKMTRCMWNRNTPVDQTPSIEIE